MNYDHNFMNLVIHPFIFEYLCFDKIKRIIENVPICIVIPKSMEKTSGVQPWTKDTKNVNFNGIRSEYISCHLKGNFGLCFSPNNMKFEVVNNKEPLFHFWAVILKENNFHHIFYYWNFIDDFNF